MEFGNWFGMFAPAGTAPEVVARLNRELNTLLKAVDLVEGLDMVGAEPAGGTPEQFAAFVKAGLARYEPVVKASRAMAD